MRIKDLVQVHGIVSIGDNCSIEKGAFLSDSVILNNVVVKEGARIERSLIGNHCLIEKDVFLGEGVCLGEGSVVTKYSRVRTGL